jgi:hypothetical protein
VAPATRAAPRTGSLCQLSRIRNEYSRPPYSKESVQLLSISIGPALPDFARATAVAAKLTVSSQQQCWGRIARVQDHRKSARFPNIAARLRMRLDKLRVANVPFGVTETQSYRALQVTLISWQTLKIPSTIVSLLSPVPAAPPRQRPSEITGGPRSPTLIDADRAPLLNWMVRAAASSLTTRTCWFLWRSPTAVA